MRISESDWVLFMGHVNETLAHFGLADAEKNDVVGFIESVKSEIVEC